MIVESIKNDNRPKIFHFMLEKDIKKGFEICKLTVYSTCVQYEPITSLWSVGNYSERNKKV